MKPVAVFDVDGTVFRSSLLIELVEGLIDAGVFPQSARDEYKTERTNWLNRKGDYEPYIRAVVGTFMRHIQGVHYGAFDEVAAEVVRLYRGRVYRFTRDLINELQKDNYFLLAVSQSPKGALDKFCDTMGFDKTYGVFYELGPSDRFTGNVADEHIISNKAHIVRRAVEKEGLTFRHSFGVGDTEDDVPFLEIVDHPVCFNPNQRLYRYAKVNQWRVVVERKDVVYEIQ